MIEFTQSMEYWICVYHIELLAPLAFGHIEVVTDELWREYVDWCKTEEGMSYLKGGSNYKEVNNTNDS